MEYTLEYFMNLQMEHLRTEKRDPKLSFVFFKYKISYNSLKLWPCKFPQSPKSKDFEDTDDRTFSRVIEGGSFYEWLPTNNKRDLLTRHGLPLHKKYWQTNKNSGTIPSSHIHGSKRSTYTCFSTRRLQYIGTIGT